MDYSDKTGTWLALAEGESVVKPFVFRNFGTNLATANHKTKELKIGTKAFDEAHLLAFVGCFFYKILAVGTVMTKLKKDPDRREPPNSVGM